MLHRLVGYSPYRYVLLLISAVINLISIREAAMLACSSSIHIFQQAQIQILIQYHYMVTRES